ncbi:MAG: hypothetical protein PHO37_14800 [Kiritimatiellae bacterium]|nr:hypothetical protein [Kiritimatiellia bacterium]
MKTLLTLLFTISFCFTLMVVAADDESKFIPKNYSGKSYKDNNYRAKSYTSQSTARSEKYRDPPNKRSFWNIFKQKEIAKPKVLDETKTNDGKPFAKSAQSPLPAKQLDEKPVKDRAFESSPEAAVAKEFVPDNRPRARDPLLAPRQGIKAPTQ